MPRQCSICSHEKRDAIERALFAGDSYREITRQFRVSKDALSRHKADHISARLAKAHEAKEVASADRLITELSSLKGKAVSLLVQAERAGDLRTVLAGVREARGCIETLLEVEGEIDRRAQVNVLVANPEWLRLRTAVLAALSEHPEARRAVVKALAEVDDHALVH